MMYNCFKCDKYCNFANNGYIELFCGTKSFSNYMKKNNIETYTVDIESKFEPDLIYDLSLPINKHIWNKIIEADCIWMSPPCQTSTD